MSRVQQAKDAQGYNPDGKKCLLCRHYFSELIEVNSRYGFGTYYEEKNSRCELGGFAVKKMASCNRFERKQTA